MHQLTYKLRARRYAALSWTLTISLMLLAFLALYATPMIDTKMHVDYVDDPPLEIVKLEQIRQLMPEFKPEHIVVEDALLRKQRKNLTARKKVTIARKANIIKKPSKRKVANPVAARTPLRKLPNLQPEIELKTNDAGISAVKVASKPVSRPNLIVPRANQGDRTVPSTISIELGTSSSMDLERGSYEIVGDHAVNAPEERNLSEMQVSVELKDVEELGDDFENLAPIYIKLIEWMKRHPVKLSRIVNAFMGTREGCLTSAAKFKSGDRDFELFLVCQEKQYEVRICIVEKTSATLLIDKGFKKQSNYFRIGTVNRTPENKIFSFGTTQESPSDSRTVEFYRIFLSWWENVKDQEKDL